jgi:two-component system chemotaxis sensor kinase CheA
VLLVEQSPFIREMLAPVIRAAGFNPIICADAAGAMAQLAARPLAALIVDIEHEASGGLAVAAAAGSALTRVALASAPHPDLLAAAHQAGIGQVVAKFDRHGLIAALKGADAAAQEAA